MSNYKESQLKATALARAWKLLKGYEFNSFPNRLKRRQGNAKGYNTTKNVQTFVKPETEAKP